MTRPSAKFTLTHEIYERFTDYHRHNLAWGIFHVWLDDGNYKGTMPEWPWGTKAEEMTDEEHELWAVFRQLSPSQISRLAKRCALPWPHTRY